MAIYVQCSECGRRLKAADKHAGRFAKCPNCHSRIQITAAPSQDETAAAVVGRTSPQNKSPDLPIKSRNRADETIDFSSSPTQDIVQAEAISDSPHDAPTLTPSAYDDRTPVYHETSPPLGQVQAPSARRFGDYELIQEIARGGMGVVYKARQLSLDRLVAIKMILSGDLASDEMVRRFRTEAEAAARLQHSGIVAIHDVGQWQGQHFFSMDFVDGRSLSDLIREGNMSPRIAATYTRQIADAIQYAHEHGILHRDLKPSNVLIDRNNQSRVTDFGLAKRVEDRSDLTQTGQILGTPSYMSPEQASGDQSQIGPATDIYSLGAILYETLTGQPPFRAPNQLDTLMAVIEQEPVPPRRVNRQLPRDLETIALKCLEKDPQQRYASAGELSDDLGRFLDGEPIHARQSNLLVTLRRWTRTHPVAGGCLFTSLGIITILAGLAMMLGGAYVGISGLFSQIGALTNEGQLPADSFTFKDAEFQTPEILLTPNGHAKLQVLMAIQTNSIELEYVDKIDELRNESDFGRTEEEDERQPRARYRFRVSYEILDDRSNTIEQGTPLVTWDSVALNHRRLKIDTESASFDRTAEIITFAVPESGKVRVKLVVHPDETYDSHVTQTELQIFDNVDTDSARRTPWGATLFFIGPVVMMLGVAFFFYGPTLALLKRRSRVR
ncbi:MAG: serine/threonine protein kinase [Planctomycetales bacterium]|nr:serine/threonine protein kinase [Planctomycetales bacterium]